MNKSKIIYFYVTVITLLLLSCDNKEEFEIPGSYINIVISLNDIEFYELQVPGNSKEISAHSLGVVNLGYDNNGIILFNNGDEFYAFDRTCPYEFPKSVAVNSDGGGSAKCPECGSIFMFTALGSPASGSLARFPLKEYRTEYSISTRMVRVIN